LKQIEVVENILEKLSQKNPLRSVHPEQGFVYLKDIIKVIGYLKKAGIGPEEFKKILSSNEKILPEIDKTLSDVFSDRISKETFAKTKSTLDKLEKISLKSRKGISINIF
jgi:hypothetical protein